MSINEINPGNSLKTGVDSFTGLPGSISDINRELFGQPLSKAPNSAFGSIPMNSLLEADDRSISAIQTKARSGASSVYGNESGIFPIDRAAQQVSKALMDNPITAPIPSGDLVDRAGQYDELLNPNPSNLSATVRSGDTQKELGTGSEWWELQKADGNGFTERVAYQLPSKEVYVVKSGDTLWEIARAKLGNSSRWRELQKADGTGFTQKEAFNLQIGTKVYLSESDSFSSEEEKRRRIQEEYKKQAYPVDENGKLVIPETNIGENNKEGNALVDKWIAYFEECRKDLKVIKTPRWKEKDNTGQLTDMKFPGLTGGNIKSPKKENGEQYDPATSRAVDIVTISRIDGTVTGIEVKTSDEEARLKRSRDQEARDIYALKQGGLIQNDDDPKNPHKPTSVDRVVGGPPNCDDPDHRKKHEEIKKLTPEATVENVQVDPNPNPPKPKPRPPVDGKPPRFNVPRPPVDGKPGEPPNPPVDGKPKPPGEPPKTNPPGDGKPPGGPPIDDARPADPRPPARPPGPPAPRPPVRPPALSGALNIGSKIARPLGLVTDVIDLKNAYDEDGGFGKNFQETAGGVAGGWGGAAAGAAGGAAIGSLAGPVGTVVGGIAGGIIGGFGGSAAGEGIVKGIRGLFG